MICYLPPNGHSSPNDPQKLILLETISISFPAKGVLLQGNGDDRPRKATGEAFWCLWQNRRECLTLDPLVLCPIEKVCNMIWTETKKCLVLKSCGQHAELKHLLAASGDGTVLWTSSKTVPRVRQGAHVQISILTEIQNDLRVSK